MTDNNVTINLNELNSDTLLCILHKIETQLHTSEVYRSAIDGLDQIFAGTKQNAQTLLKAVTREAIKIAITTIQSSTPINRSPESITPSNQSHLEVFPLIDTPTIKIEETKEKTTSIPSTILSLPNLTQTNSQVTSQHRHSNTHTKKLTKAEQQQQQAQQFRIERIIEVGQILKEARLDLALSHKQLQQKTLISARYIQALEDGQTDNLPEHSYLIGFVQKLSKVLGLNGQELAKKIPSPDHSHISSSWNKSDTHPETNLFHLQPVHLYVGYTALMAGAIGGLSYVSQSPIPQVSIEAPTNFSQQKQIPKSDIKTPIKPGIKSESSQGVSINSDIARPEFIR